MTLLDFLSRFQLVSVGVRSQHVPYATSLYRAPTLHTYYPFNLFNK